MVDGYLEFLAARCRPNTVLAAGFDRTFVTCTYTGEDAWSVALGANPTQGADRYVIQDGQITRVDHDVDIGEYHTQVCLVLAGWVRENHPEGFA